MGDRTVRPQRDIMKTTSITIPIRKTIREIFYPGFLTMDQSPAGAAQESPGRQPWGSGTIATQPLEGLMN
jgi:hypothetical protein